MRYHFLLDFVYGYRNIGIIRAESGQNIVRDICRGIAEAQRLAVLMRNAKFLQQRVIIHQCPLGKIIKVLAEMVEIYVPPLAVEQRRSQLRFDILQHHAERRLGDKKRF